jgi:nucleotide-binding universal stress UspA family protein
VKIVHPTDFSAEAEAAEQEAVRLARRLNAELVLVHVATETPLYGEQMFAMPDVKRIYEAQARWAEERLAERAAALTREGIPARWRRRVGVVHAEIGTVAREEAADYIVIGTHGRGGLDRVMLGSVAERVVRTAPCPVITVRQR